MYTWCERKNGGKRAESTRFVRDGAKIGMFPCPQAAYQSVGQYISLDTEKNLV